MQHFYRNVPGIGNVALSRHAQDQAVEHAVSDHDVATTLAHGTDRPDGLGVVWREHAGVRLVIVLRPEPFSGAALVTTLYRPEQQARTKQ